MTTRRGATAAMYRCAYPSCKRLLSTGSVCVDHQAQWNRYVLSGRIKAALRFDFQAFLKEEKLARKKEKWS